MDLGRIITVDQPLRRASYVLREIGSPTLADVLAPHIAAVDGPRGADLRSLPSPAPITPVARSGGPVEWGIHPSTDPVTLM